MGYNANQVGQNFFIDKAYVQIVAEVIKNMPDHYQSWNPKFKELTDVRSILMAWGYEIEFNNDGDIVTIYFINEKVGDELDMLKVIAPYVRAGSFIEMNGEDGHRWRYWFDGKTCVEQEGKIVYEF